MRVSALVRFIYIDVFQLYAAFVADFPECMSKFSPAVPEGFKGLLYGFIPAGCSETEEVNRGFVLIVPLFELRKLCIQRFNINLGKSRNIRYFFLEFLTRCRIISV